MWKPTTRQLELIAEMAHGGMAPDRIAAALGISPGVLTAWVSRLEAVRALSPEDVEMLLYPPKPRAVQPPPPRHDPRIIAEHYFEAAE
jgi:transposase-like protein